MSVRSHAQEPPMSSTTPDRDSVIQLAIALSYSTWLVAARLPGDERPRLRRSGGGDTAGLVALISSLRARVAARLGAPIGVVCCFEAGRDGFWLHRLLTAHVVSSATYSSRPASSSTAVPAAGQNRPARRGGPAPRADGLPPR